MEHLSGLSRELLKHFVTSHGCHQREGCSILFHFCCQSQEAHTQHALAHIVNNKLVQLIILLSLAPTLQAIFLFLLTLNIFCQLQGSESPMMLGDSKSDLEDVDPQFVQPAGLLPRTETQQLQAAAQEGCSSPLIGQDILDSTTTPIRTLTLLVVMATKEL